MTMILNYYLKKESHGSQHVALCIDCSMLCSVNFRNDDRWCGAGILALLAVGIILFVVRIFRGDD